MLLNAAMVKVSKQAKERVEKKNINKKEIELGVGFRGHYLEACFTCNHIEDQDSQLTLFSNHL
jgi:hypothetical protein